MFRLFQSAKQAADTSRPAARREPQLPLLVAAIPARGPAVVPQRVPVEATRRIR